MTKQITSSKSSFIFTDERFADIQMLRYELSGFDSLSLNQKRYIYYLSEATLAGRDIIYDQFGKYNLLMRKTLESILQYYTGEKNEEYDLIIAYLKRVWFSNGIYHHYGCEKFVPEFSEEYFVSVVKSLPDGVLPLEEGQTVEDLLKILIPVIFDPTVLPKRVNKAAGEDLIKTSACNYYEGVTQKEVEDYYAKLKTNGPKNHQPSYGLNTSLVKHDGVIQEITWKIGGKYGKAIEQIVFWLKKAKEFAENAQQVRVIDLLTEYYTTGDLSVFDAYSIEWLKEQEGRIDFINGFIEVYGDPLGLKASWEGIVEYKDLEATKRTQTISQNAQWFEDHSPVDPLFKKEKVKGVTANVINAAMLGGDEYPSTAIGINLPNADWIRAEHGSKSVTIANLTHAYDMASKGNGFLEEFVIDEETCKLIKTYGDLTDNLHTDLHECLGHGSGKLLSGTDPDALKNYGNTIEEARADLFGLYYIADKKLIKLGLIDSEEAFKAQYYTYMMNGLLTQQVRIKPEMKIEEAHMQNRALIAWWAMDLGKKAKVVEFVEKTDPATKRKSTFVKINDYLALRDVFAKELAEIQRIKSEGDYDAAKVLVEKYAVHLNKEQHGEVLDRYVKLNIAPYKGFINPVMEEVKDGKGNIIDIAIDYTESYTDQMLRYSRDYSTLI